MEYTIVNTKIPEYSVPKTGDNSSPLFMFLILAISGIGVMFGISKLTKRKVKSK